VPPLIPEKEATALSDFQAAQKRVPIIQAPPEWGIDPVPKAHRILGFLDYAVLWGDLGIGLLVMLAGTFLIPGLSLGPALLAIVVGTALGCILLALVGVVGSDTGVPTMVLLRPVLGERGSWLPTALNAVQLLGWTIFEFVIMGVAADAIGKTFFGASHSLVWTVLFAVVVVVMALGGPVGFVRQWLEKFAVWVALGTGLWLSWHLLSSYDLPSLGKKAGDSSLGFWVAVDIVIALPISWLPLVADYNRFAKRSSRAFWGTLLGFFATSVWFLAMGATLMLGAGLSQDPRDFATAFALIAGWGALLVILADETHNAWADLYSAAVSIQNVFPKAKQRRLILALGVFCLLVAAALDVTRYQNFLFLVGSFFIPLFGILVADYFVLRRRSYPPSELLPEGSAGGLRAFNPGGLAVWILGIAVYHIANPATLAAFFPKWGTTIPPALTSFGGSLPSFAFAFLGYLAAGRLAAGRLAANRVASRPAATTKGD
jgi:putative hydroxymethylpyrimidine transporter CytX